MIERPTLAIGNHYDLKPWLRKELLDLASCSAPNEICGFATGFSEGGVITYWRMHQVDNISSKPTEEFLIGQNDFVRALTLSQHLKCSLAIWHSHPHGIPCASRSDIGLLLHLQEIPFIIVGVEHRLIYVYETIEANGMRPQPRKAASIYVPME